MKKQREQGGDTALFENFGIIEQPFCYYYSFLSEFEARFPNSFDYVPKITPTFKRNGGAKGR
jgi:hypothetical protein